MEDYIKCELIDGGSNTFEQFIKHVYCCSLHHCIVDMIDCPCKPCCLLQQTNQGIPNLVAIVDCTYAGSATASFKDLKHFAGEQIFW